MDDFNLDNINQSDIPDEQKYKRLKNFNLGALILGPIWCYFNGLYKYCYWLLLFLGFQWIPIINILFGNIVYIIAVIILGFKGNEWAYNSEHKDWKSFREFEDVQKKWNIAAIIVVVVFFIINSIITSNIKAFYSELFSSYDNCNNVKSCRKETLIDKEKDDYFNKVALSYYFRYDDYKENYTENDMFESIFNKFEISSKSRDDVEVVKVTKNSMRMYVNGKEDTFYIYLILNKKDNCSLKKKNCYIVTYEYDNNINTRNMKTYFDDKGNIKSVKLVINPKK